MAHATNDQGALVRARARAGRAPARGVPNRRSALSQRLPPTVRRRAAAASDRLGRPWDAHEGACCETRSGSLRPCPPPFRDPLPGHAKQRAAPRRQAVDLGPPRHTPHRRAVPAEAPTDGVPRQGRPAGGAPDGPLDRHAEERGPLWARRGARRAGNVWGPNRRRSAPPDTSLSPQARGPARRADVCQPIRAPANGTGRRAARGRALTALRPRVDRLWARPRTGGAGRLDQGRVVGPPLEAAARPARVTRLAAAVASRLPLLDVPAGRIEGAPWTGGSRPLRHLGGHAPRRPAFLPRLSAARLAPGGHLGLARMAQMAASAATRPDAPHALVTWPWGLPLSQPWGGGTLASAAGQRLPGAGKRRQAPPSHATSARRGCPPTARRQTSARHTAPR